MAEPFLQQRRGCQTATNGNPIDTANKAISHGMGGPSAGDAQPLAVSIGRTTRAAVSNARWSTICALTRISRVVAWTYR